MELLLSVLLLISADVLPRAGRDVPLPERVHYVEPEMPDPAKSAGLMGFVLLEVTVGVEGKPTDITVVYGLPLLDFAAVEAVRQWRYETTLAQGRPTPVLLRELVEFFPDKETEARFYVRILENEKEDLGLRLLALSRLGAADTLPSFVVKALEKAKSSHDPQLATAAAQALADIGARKER
jgi:TonB family protein